MFVCCKVILFGVDLNYLPADPFKSTKFSIRFPCEALKVKLNDSSLGPICKRKQIRTISNLALDDIDDAFDSRYGYLGAILGYRFIYGKEEYQLAI